LTCHRSPPREATRARRSRPRRSAGVHKNLPPNRPCSGYK
jgi:hypothetical protein